MKYLLGIDVGTSYTAAATWRLDDQQHPSAEVVPLGSRASALASVLYLGADGSVVVGEAAERRALTDPDRVVREFKRRVGDETPLFVGGQPYAADDLVAMLVRWVVDRVTEREGGPPDRIAITHPASWGPYKKALLRTALAAFDLVDLTLLAEPEAAAVNYAAQERVEAGSTIAVYDLGGGTFDAAVVCKAGADTFTLLGSADGLEQLGGADFDEAVFAHVRAVLGEQWDNLDIDDPGTLSGLAALRRECTEAKEALSADTEVSIAVLLPGLNCQVRLGRSDFEETIRPAVEDTVDSLSRAIGSAGITSADLAAVLLVGGSSRVPLVAQLVSARLGRPVVTDADPKATIALGAALSMAAGRQRASMTIATPVDAPTENLTTPELTGSEHTGPVHTGPVHTGPHWPIPPGVAGHPQTAALPQADVVRQRDVVRQGDTVRQPGSAPLTAPFAFDPEPETLPNRPPVVSAARPFTEDRTHPEDRTPAKDRTPRPATASRSPRRKLIEGAVFGMIVTGLVVGALLLVSNLVPQLSTFAGMLRGAPSSNADVPNVTTSPNPGDRDKASTAGSLGDSRSRSDPAVLVPAPAPGTVEQPAPAERDQPGVSPPAPPPAPPAPSSSATRPSPSQSARPGIVPQPEPTSPTTEPGSPSTPPSSAEPAPSPSPDQPPSEQPSPSQPPASPPPPSQPPDQPPADQPPSAQPSSAQSPSAQPPSGTPPTGPSG